jgi:predicted dehydrogenase
VESFSLPEGFDRNDLFLAQTRHFLNIVRGEDEPVCTLEDGIRVQELVQAARESETGGQLMEFRK